MSGINYVDVVEFVLNQSTIEPLEDIIRTAKTRIDILRQAREKPCKWGVCNGIIGPDKKCTRCGQEYV